MQDWPLSHYSLFVSIRKHDEKNSKGFLIDTKRTGNNRLLEYDGNNIGWNGYKDFNDCVLFYFTKKWTMFCFIHSRFFLIFDIDWNKIIFFKLFWLVDNSSFSFSTINLEIKWLIKCYWSCYFESEFVDCFVLFFYYANIITFCFFKEYKFWITF